MLPAADKAVGFATAATGVSGIGWLSNSTFLSTLGFLASVATTLAAWWMIRKEKQADFERRERMANAVEGIQVGQAAALDEMLARLRHLEVVIVNHKDKA